MARHEKGNDPGIFTRAASDELKQLQISYGVRWRLHVVASDQGGVFSFVWSAVESTNPLDGKSFVTYTAHWPNSTPCTWEAFAYQCAHRLARMVESYYEEQARLFEQGRTG